MKTERTFRNSKNFVVAAPNAAVLLLWKKNTQIFCDHYLIVILWHQAHGSTQFCFQGCSILFSFLI